MQALRLCESTAGRHIAAARVCRAHPQVFAWVASGELHASALSLLRKHLTPENAAELFERCRRQSARQVEELLAARFPRPDVRDLVRRLPARAEVTLDVGRAPKHDGRLPEKAEAAQCAQAVNETNEAPLTEQIFVRDRGQCTFVAPDGRRCRSQHRLELDHIVPRALGGNDSISNLRLRCRAHNQHYARKCFRPAYLQAVVRMRRSFSSQASK